MLKFSVSFQKRIYFCLQQKLTRDIFFSPFFEHFKDCLGHFVNSNFMRLSIEINSFFVFYWRLIIIVIIKRLFIDNCLRILKKRTACKGIDDLQNLIMDLNFCNSRQFLLIDNYLNIFDLSLVCFSRGWLNLNLILIGNVVSQDLNGPSKLAHLLLPFMHINHETLIFLSFHIFYYKPLMFFLISSPKK